MQNKQISQKLEVALRFILRAYLPDMTVQLLILTAVSQAPSEPSGLFIVPKLSIFASGHEHLCCGGSLPSPFVSIVTANS